LLCMQQMCPEYGPSLSMDQQLHWILEPQIFHASLSLCTLNHILRANYPVL
jgi:hypothetical protein